MVAIGLVPGDIRVIKEGMSRATFALECAGGDPTHLKSKADNELLDLGFEEEEMDMVNPYLLILMRRIWGEVKDCEQTEVEEPFMLFLQNLSLELEELLFSKSPNTDQSVNLITRMILEDFMGLELVRSVSDYLLDKPFLDGSESLFLSSWIRLNYLYDSLNLPNDARGFWEELYSESEEQLSGSFNVSPNQELADAVREINQGENIGFLLQTSPLFQSVIREVLDNLPVSLDSSALVKMSKSPTLFVQNLAVELRNLIESENLTFLTTYELIREFRSLNIVRRVYNNAVNLGDLQSELNKNIVSNIDFLLGLGEASRNELE